MRGDERERVRRGKELLVDLPEVSLLSAPPEIHPTLADIQMSLRVPALDELFAYLANFPQFLKPAWEALRHRVRSFEFERDADWLRAGSVVRPAPIGRVVRSAAGEELDRFRAVTDTAHYVLPKVLLIVTAFDAMDHAWKGRHPRGETELFDPELPAGLAPGAVDAPLVEPEEASPELRSLYDDIISLHEHPIVPRYFRALGTRPDFLRAVWDELSDVVTSGPYLQRKRLLLRASELVVAEWYLPDLPDSAQCGDVSALLAVFRQLLTPDTLLDVSFIKGMLDGELEARHSHLSALHV